MDWIECLAPRPNAVPAPRGSRPHTPRDLSRRALALPGLALWLLLAPAATARAGPDAGGAPPGMRVLAAAAYGRLVASPRGSDLANDPALRETLTKAADIAIAEGLRPRSGSKSMETRRVMAESGRTDQALGASPAGAGTTSLVEKPGIPGLIAFAIEHGAIEKKVSGNAATLSSSLFLIAQLFDPGSPAEGYPESWKRIGVSATMGLTGEGQQLDLDHPTEWSARWQFLGDRSVLARSFVQHVNRSVAAVEQRRVEAGARVVEGILAESGTFLARAREHAVDAVIGELQFTSSVRINSRDLRADQLEAMITGVLERELTIPIREGTLFLDPAALPRIDEAWPALLAADREYQSALRSVDSELVKRSTGRILSVTYHDLRGGPGEDVAEGKLLFENHARNIDAVVNAGMSFYRDRRMVLSAHNRKEWSLSGSLEHGRVAVSSDQKPDQSKVLTSVALKLAWPESADQPEWIFQLRGEIPLGGGAAIPLSISRAWGGTPARDSDLRASLGISLATDKLFMLRNAN